MSEFDPGSTIIAADGAAVRQGHMESSQNLIDRLYTATGAVGKTGKKFEQFTGLSTASNLKGIESLMTRCSPASTLEIGMAFGASTIVFGAFHKARDPLGSFQHTAIDPFQSTVWDSVGRMKLEEADLARYVRVVEEKSSLALPRLVAEEQRYGLIYIDGSHLFEDVFIDAYFCARLLNPNGYLMFDDCSDPHVAKVIAFIDASLPGLERQREGTIKQKIARMVGKRQLTIYRLVGPIERAWNAAFRRF